MDISLLKRDASKVHACLAELPNGKLIAKKELRIYIPARFAERSLAEIGNETNIVGIYAIVTEDNYFGISLVTAMMRIEPSATLRIKINGVEYYEFIFNPGDCVCASTSLVKTDTIVYKIYDEIISKANVPWYINYEDLGRIFDTAKYHAGTNIGANPEVTELIISMIARDKEDKTKYFRTILDKQEDISEKVPAFISLKSVIYAATNTTNKLAGSYMSQGITSALVSPSDREERIESLLRA